MRYLLLLLVVFLSHQMMAQDYHFSQPRMMPLLINPAYAGTANGTIRAGLNYKEQLRSVSTPYRTIAASLDAALMKKKLKKQHFGAGMYLLRDKSGDLGYGMIVGKAMFSYHISLSKRSSLSAGVSGGITQSKLNFDDQRRDIQYSEELLGHDGAQLSGESLMIDNTLYGDIGAGVSYTFNKPESRYGVNDGKLFRISTAVLHINRPQISLFKAGDSKLQMRYSIHGVGSFGIKASSWQVQPEVIVYMQGPASMYYFGSAFRYQASQKYSPSGLKNKFALALGAYYRWDDALVLSTWIEFDRFAVGVSYDINMAKLKTVSNGRGGVELGIQYISSGNLNDRASGALRFL